MMFSAIYHMYLDQQQVDNGNADIVITLVL